MIWFFLLPVYYYQTLPVYIPYATPGKFCTVSDADFDGYRYPEHIAHCHRNISKEQKRTAANIYGIAYSDWNKYEFDHLIPLSIGGANDVLNLWPEPIADAKLKDDLEFVLFNKISTGEVTQANAAKQMIDWAIRSNQNLRYKGKK